MRSFGDSISFKGVAKMVAIFCRRVDFQGYEGRLFKSSEVEGCILRLH